MCAFLGLFGLMLGSGLAAIRDLDRMHAEEQAARREFFQRTQALSGLCLSIELYSDSVQHYLANDDNADEAAIRGNLGRLQNDINSALGSYGYGRHERELLSLRTIEGLFVRQKDLVLQMFAWSADERRRRAPLLVHREVAPLETEILERSDQLRVENDQQLHETDQELLAQFADLQAGLTRSIALSLASGLVLILASMSYILRLERQTRFRYVEVVRSRYELEQLSARLVDAQETERRNISRELHDEVGQTLGALLVDFGRLLAALPEARPELREQVERMKSVAERSVQSVRNLALLLRPSMLDDLGLVAALEWQGREVSRNSETEVDVQSANVSEDLPDDYKVTIYRLVQEALHNAVRHSGARNAWVRVEQDAGRIRVQVADDGRGFDATRTRGLGILGMEERVKRLGGTLAIESQPGRGTTVRAELPLRSEERAA